MRNAGGRVEEWGGTTDLQSCSCQVHEVHETAFQVQEQETCDIKDVFCLVHNHNKSKTGLRCTWGNLTNHWTKAAVLLDQKMSAIVALLVFDQLLFAITWLFCVCIYAGGIWCGTKEILSLDLQGSRVSEGSSVWHGPQVDPTMDQIFDLMVFHSLCIYGIS